MTTVRYEFEYIQYLDEHANVIKELPDFAQDKDELVKLYHNILLTRALDKKAVALQRTGLMGTYPSSLGQEAVAVGMGHALGDDDVFVPYYRDQGTMLIRGFDPALILSYWGGDERASDYPIHREDLPPCIPIATQSLHAAGVAYAIKLRQQPRAVLTTIGDGGTSKGDFYEAMNFSGVNQLPVVFVVNNNQWAISVPRKIQTAAESIAQKAIAAGIQGVVVDGNDVIAVSIAVQQSLANARAGNGPTLIEANTYRLCDHTTADDATRYVDPDELAQARTREPVIRLKQYLMAQHGWSDDQDQQLIKQCQNDIDKAVKAYKDTKPDQATAIFDHLYSDLPPLILQQRQDMSDSL